MINFCGWNPSWDMNHNGVVTISDFGSLFLEWLLAPGMLITNLIQDTSVGLFFEMSYYTCRGLMMSTFSFLFWIFILFNVLMFGAAFKDWLLANPPKRF
jgi:hypothetical protein